eukprot:scaffold2716_cov179-Amphora_coffeaeformis.AAC.11
MNRRQVLCAASVLFIVVLLQQAAIVLDITRKKNIRPIDGVEKSVNRTQQYTQQHHHDSFHCTKYMSCSDNYGNGADVSPTRLLPAIDTQNTSYCHMGRESDGGNRVLAKIRHGLGQRKQQRRQNRYNKNQEGSSIKLLCLIYTYDAAHPRVRAIAQTWGRQCDGFLAASNVTDASIGAINLPHTGPETYENMWQKIRSMWNYTYQHYRAQFDYFYILGDDMYVAVENVRAYLRGNSIQRLLEGQLDAFSTRNKRARDAAQLRPRPLLLGFSVPFNLEFTFPLGGCGYFLNRAALDLFVEHGLQEWYPDLVDSREDVLMGAFFWEHGVTTSDFRDDDGAFLCQAMTAGQMFDFDGRRSQARPELLQKQYGVNMRKGMCGVSRTTTAFHLKGNRTMRVNAVEKMYHYHVMLAENSPCYDDKSKSAKGT